MSRLNTYRYSLLAAGLVLGFAVYFGFVDAQALGFLPFIGMAFPADAIDNVDLKALAAGGLVNEDVADKIFRLSVVQTPFQDAIETGQCNQDYTEWAFEELGAPSTSKVRVHGSNPSTYEGVAGTRVGNRTQVNARTLAVSSSLRNSVNLTGEDYLAYKTALEMQRIRQDIEAHITSNQASVADDNNTTAGKAGGFSAWLTTSALFGATGANGGFNTGTKLVVAPTVGTKRTLAWASMVGANNLTAFTAFGNPTLIMSTAQMVQKINQKFVDLTIKAAPMQANIPGEGGKAIPMTAQGWFQVFVNEFGVAQTIAPNRLMQTYGSTAVDVLGIDPNRAALLYLDGYRVTPIVTSGLNYVRDVTVEWSLRVDNEAAHWVVRDIDPTVAPTA